MSVTAIFVPGIMGSELQLPNGEVVWPPNLAEAIGGYRRIDKLQDPSLRPIRIIPNVGCVDFYRPMTDLFRQLGFDNTGDKRLIELAYDWRRDLFDVAKGLVDVANGVTSDEIVIVAHSMGGLVARLALEAQQFRGAPFLAKVRSFIALATPHHGAPLALARVMGLDTGDRLISPADFRRLAANESYPSGYQLLPAPAEGACWDIATSSGLAPVNFYTSAGATRLGMKPAMVARVKAVHDAFHAGGPPNHVRYFFFAGAGHKTCTRVNVNGTSGEVIFTDDSGDGTVPIWSALPRPGQKQVVINEHSNVFRGLPFKRVFFRLLGADAGAPKETIEALEAEAAATRPLLLSLQRQVFEAGAPIEVVVTADDPITDLDGRLVFDRLTEADRVAAEAVAVQPVRYQGPGVPDFGMTLQVDLAPGFYELRYEGDRPQYERATFAVQKWNALSRPRG